MGKRTRGGSGNGGKGKQRAGAGGKAAVFSEVRQSDAKGGPAALRDVTSEVTHAPPAVTEDAETTRLRRELELKVRISN